MVTLLTESDVADLIDLASAMECMESVYQEQARGQVTASPPSMVRSGGGLLLIRSGGLADAHHYGVRISTGPNAPAYALVFESPAGRLLAVIEYPFSELRVGATVGVAVNRLAQRDARHVAMIGSGRLAWSIVPAVCAVRQLESVRVYSPTPSHRAEFAARVERELDISATAVDGPAAAIEGADIVLVAAAATEPVLKAEWLPPAALVVGAGNRPELGTDVFQKADLIVTTSKVHDRNVGDWPLVRLIGAGELDWDGVAELGDVISGRLSPRDGLTVFREAQGGFSDIALASLAYQRASALGRGQLWPAG